MEDDDDDDDAKAAQRRRGRSSFGRREIRVALAKAYLECKMEKDLETVVASVVLSTKNELENDISNLWRNARVDDEEEEEGEEENDDDDDDALQTALGEVLMEKLLPKGGRKTSEDEKFNDDDNNNKRRKVVEEGHERKNLQRFCEEYEENALKLKRDVLREEVSVLKWREERVKEKKKHMEKRRRVEESTGLPYVPELRKPTKAEVERFVREVEGGLEKKEYAPQFKEILDRVRKVMEGKKKKRDDGDGGGGRALVESAAAEYAMLHLGGAKYRAKKFELPRVEEEGDGEKIKEEEEDNDDEGHENDDKKEEEEDLEAKRREEQCEREFQLELEKSREANGISGKKVVGANANVITHERWEGRMNSTKNASAAINGKHGADVEYLTYRDVIPNMNKVDDVDWEKCGRLGERVVFNVLIQKYRGTNVSVKWVNENEESNAFYDIMLIDPDSQSKTFIEVKATRFRDKNAFEISPWEWDFAVKPEVADRYQIWRVFGIGDGGDVNIVVINNPARLLREKKIGQALII